MTVEIILNEKVVASTRNLSVIQKYNTSHPVQGVAIHALSDGSAKLNIYWQNGATCRTTFASFEVCKDWCERNKGIKRADNTSVYPYESKPC